VNADTLDTITSELSFPIDVVTSAKTGENVEHLFTGLAADFLD